MNLNTLIPSQTHAHNRMTFDQQALDQAIVRAEARRGQIRALWARLRAGIGRRARAQSAMIATEPRAR